MSDLIRRDDAFKAVLGVTTYDTVDDVEIHCDASVAGSEGWLGGVRDSLRAIEDVPSAEPEPKWIPVTEALPINDVDVIVSVLDDSGDTPYRFTSVGWCTPNGQYWVVDNEMCYGVVAWQPLPEPWKGER